MKGIVRGVIFLFPLFIATISFANQIDSLKTDKDIEIFLQKQDSQNKTLHLSSLKRFYSISPKFDTTTELKIADSLGVKIWQKVDFDNNGLTDILILGNDEQYHYVFVVTDEGKKFKLHRFSPDFSDDEIFYPIVRTVKNKNLLFIYRSYWDCEICPNRNKKKLDSFMLIYLYSNFIESNFHPVSYSIKKIEFSTEACYGTCPIFELEINSNGKAFYNAYSYNERNGKFSATVQYKDLEKIVELLNYIDFPNLKDSFSVKWSDQPSCNLLITYGNVKVKKIWDYGERGSYGLSALYQYLFDLRKNQDWKLR
jgi:hypothetical protein